VLSLRDNRQISESFQNGQRQAVIAIETIAKLLPDFDEFCGYCRDAINRVSTITATSFLPNFSNKTTSVAKEYHITTTSLPH
jgi:hypothetical protein